MISMELIELISKDFKQETFKILDGGRNLGVNGQAIKHNWINNELEFFHDLDVALQRKVYEDIKNKIITITGSNLKLSSSEAISEKESSMSQKIIKKDKITISQQGIKESTE